MTLPDRYNLFFRVVYCVYNPGKTGDNRKQNCTAHSLVYQCPNKKTHNCGDNHNNGGTNGFEFFHCKSFKKYARGKSSGDYGF